MNANLKKWLQALVFVALGAGTASAEPLAIAVGLSLPPYVIQESGEGMEMDVVMEALGNQGYEVSPRYVPFARVPMMLKSGLVQGATPMNESIGVENVHFSDVHIVYQNVAVSLKEHRFRIDTVRDLDNKRIIAFQNATKYLGPEFLAVSRSSPEYEEKANQELQLNRLFLKRTDVIVLDVNIFKYYREKMAREAGVAGLDVRLPVEVHEIFPKTEYKVAFSDAGIRDRFNEGLARLRESGRYDRIMERWSFGGEATSSLLVPGGREKPAAN